LKAKKSYILIAVVALVALLASCSTEKNTSRSRWWHSFNARYNTYYNGSVAYIDASLEKENGNKDNFTEMIPMYTVGNKKSRELGKANYDKAIEKCEKAIKLHSITKRPEWTKSRRKTERDIEWLSRKEYNPFLWKAWMLMGRSQFYQGAFDEAASTFSYMCRLYATQPAIYGRARAWLAKSYIEQDWLYDAEDVIRNMQRDSIHWRAQKEWDFTYADYYIHTGDYDKAIPYLKKSIDHEMRKKQKARLCFLLGQLYAATGKNVEAYKAFKSVVRKNPPYELEFNARIAMTEVMGASQAKKMVGKLKRMAASDKNKDYLDQVYYAIGNIYLAQKDTLKAISNYEKGNKKATRSGIEKGVLLLKLGDLYWQQEKFSDAQRCYGEAIGLLDKDRKDYEQLSARSKVLDELVPYTDAIHLQDSLQALAKMSEKDRNAAIDRVIAELKRQEKEQKRLEDEKNAQQTMQRNGAMGNRNNTNRNNTAHTQQNNRQNAVWYFYNAMAVQQGKQAFEKLWGKRENTDNWQRVNKTVVGNLNGDADMELTEEQKDSIAKAEQAQDSLEQLKDSAQNDPHKREYYLVQIPFTEDQVATSNLTIMDGLYNSGVIFKDKLDNLDLSKKQFTRLETQYPDFEQKADMYYHLFLLYSRLGQHDVAAGYVEKLKAEYPENQWTILLTDPYFKENAQFGVHIEDSLYAATYDAFKADRLSEAKANAQISATRFPLGENRDKFLFIGGLAKLNDGDSKGCVDDMKAVVEKFPQSKLAEMAGMIVNGVNAGKPLHGARFDLGDVWTRRTAVLADSDSINAKTFDAERNTEFVFMLAYVPDSVDENKLLYQMAKVNFTHYVVRNFDLAIEDANGLRRMVVRGFRNYDEALQYARGLAEQAGLQQLLSGCKAIVISNKNLPLLGTNFSYADYQDFYDKNFAPLKISSQPLLTEPIHVAPKEDAERETSAPAEAKAGNENSSNTDGELLLPVEEEVKKKAEANEEIIPLEPEKKVENNNVDDTIIPLEPEKKVENNNNVDDTIIPLEPEKNQNAGNNENNDDEIIIIDDDSNKATDDEIYFEDTPQPQQNKKEAKKQEKYELEDEYFDLDGF
jgi:tetratricopeptide (TPR) repeat protein